MAVLVYALSGRARAGATRSAYVSPTRVALAARPVITINSVDRSNYCDLETIEILDDLSELPNTLTLQCFGFTPANNQIVRITVAGVKEFEGRITGITEYHDRLNNRTVYRVSCTDYTYDFDALLATKVYGSQSGTTTAADIVSTFSTGFTQAHIAASLPTVSAIQFKMTKPSTALRQLCDAIGGDFYVDYDKDVHVFVTETDILPDTISSSTKNWRAFRYRSMIERVANRIFVEGASTQVSRAVQAGETSINVLDDALFSTSGGSVITGNQIITYTGMSPVESLDSWEATGGPLIGGNAVVWAPELGIFVTVGPSGGVMTSRDGENWTVRTMPVTVGTLTGLVWAASLSLFVAVAGNGTNRVATSPDGITWTAQTAAAVVQWSDVAWSPSLGLFVAVASSGTAAQMVMTSPDGITWTSRTAPNTNAWAGVTWAASLGLFVAVAGTAVVTTTVMTSANGTTWTVRTASVGSTWQGVTWSPALGLFAAVANSGTLGQLVMTSPDGTTWTTRASVAACSRIEWITELSLFIGHGATGVQTSLNGTTWTLRAGGLIGFAALAWSPSLRIVTGMDSTGVLRISRAGVLLSGIPASGTGSIQQDLAEGDDLNTLAQRDDATSQATYGIRHFYVQDRRLSLASAQARGDAELVLRKDPYIEGAFITTDSKVRSGRRVTIDMAAWGISGTFTISNVRVYWDKDKARVQREVTFSSNSGDNDLYRILRRLQDQQ